FGIAAALVGAGDAKFSGGMKRKKRECLLKSSDGLVVALQLRVQIADEIPGIGFVGNLCHVRESLDAFFRLTEIFVNKTEVVPGVGILRKFFRGGGERRARRFELLLCQEGNAEIKTRD